MSASDNYGGSILDLLCAASMICVVLLQQIILFSYRRFLGSVIPDERNRTMKDRAKMTLKQLFENMNDDETRKLPTVRYLRENGEIYARSTVAGNTITVYTNGFFVYDDGLHATVQRVSRCRENVLYEFQDGTKELITFESFADRPFCVRLAIEGEKRLDINYLVRTSGRVYSYDGSEMESSDLMDGFDFAEKYAELDERSPILRKLRQGLLFLTEHQLMVIQKYFCEGKTHQKIADELGCSKQAVGKSYRSALKKLKDYMEQKR